MKEEKILKLIDKRIKSVERILKNQYNVLTEFYQGSLSELQMLKIRIEK